MPLTKETLERQLQLASADLDSCVAQLDEKGVAADQRRRDSVWRNKESKVRSIKKRIAAVVAIEERDAECERRKAEKAGE